MGNRERKIYREYKNRAWGAQLDEMQLPEVSYKWYGLAILLNFPFRFFVTAPANTGGGGVAHRV